MATEKALARIAGLLYLLMAVMTVIAGVAQGSQVVPGDAATTSANIQASAGLFRVGILADLVSATAFLLTAMALHRLLRHVNGPAAAAMVTLVAVSVAIQALALAGELAALAVATEPAYAATFGDPGTDALVLLFVSLQRDGYLMSQMFFALWLVPLGYLVVRSGYFPKVLGYLVVLACLGYLIDLAATILVPDLEPAILPVSAVAGVAGELGLMAWLLVKGVRIVDGERGIPGAGRTMAAESV